MKSQDIPALSPEQMREVDELMVDFYGIEVLQMMEHDARALAEVAKQMLGGSVAGQSILVVAGQGGNGAGGLAAARHMHNAGARVIVIILDKLSLEGQHHKETLEKIGISVSEYRVGADLSAALPDLVLDALLGYSAHGAPRPPYDGLIDMINTLGDEGAKVLANDLPSGLDPASGVAYQPCVRASATVTLALPKAGLLAHGAAKWTGELYLADIGVPRELYGKMGLEVSPDLFEKKWLVKLN